MDFCFSPGLIPLDEAVIAQIENITPIAEWENCLPSKSMDRICAEDILAPIDVPSANNSAMDGYALKAVDKTKFATLNIVGESFAGHPYTGRVNSGEAIRIMTGALVPGDCDSVVMQEQTSVNDKLLSINADVVPGQCVRLAGEDIQRNQIVIEKGRRISPPLIALMASLGIAEIKVYRKPRVGIITTGDELKSAGQTLKPGEIYESNRHGIRAMLDRFGAEVIDYGILPDNKDTIKQTFTLAKRECDWIISSGGVSVGDADYVKEAVQELGEINFWKVAIKPGKPYAFGKLEDTIFSGLPGNPVSSFVTFHRLVLPALSHLAGEVRAPDEQLNATLTKEVRRRPGRQDFQRGVFCRENDGTLSATPLPKQGSGVMSSFASANCFIVLPAESESLKSGESVSILPFDHFLK